MAAPYFFEEKRGNIKPRLGRNITCPFAVRKAVKPAGYPAFTSWA
jgi:hypothetical protein